MFKRYVIYGLCGWCMEVFWTGICSLIINGDYTLTSQTFIWMFFIYGLGVFLEPLHDKMRDLPIILRGGVYAALIFLIEFLTGSLLKIVIGRCPWNYSYDFPSINGIITFYYTPVWFFAGLFFEKIHDYLKNIELKLKN